MLDSAALRSLATTNTLPLYVYSLEALKERVQILLNQKLPYGFVPRYAAKANMNPEIIKLFAEHGLWFDASSSYEALELIELGVTPERISVSSQQPAHNLEELLAKGVLYTATSLHQLQLFAEAAGRPSEVGLRVNPGVGAGGNNRTSTGGVNSSFGLWHEYLPQALELAQKNDIKITRLHIHYGSGADPSIWGDVLNTTLEVARAMPDVTSIDVGGGFKVKRYEGETEADMAAILSGFAPKLEAFAAETGRKLQLEIEPGTWLVAHAGTLLANVVDIVDTGTDGHHFLRLNTGMNDLIRPTMYGSQHEITVLNDATEQAEYVVVGHNCETGDILTPAPGDPDGLALRTLSVAAIGDVVAIADAGAYGRYFAAAGYNSYPSANEICV